MKKFVKGQAVKLPNGRRGVVLEVDAAKGMVRCTLDTAGVGATPTAWYDMREVNPVTERAAGDDK